MESCLDKRNNIMKSRSWGNKGIVHLWPLVNSLSKRIIIDIYLREVFLCIYQCLTSVSSTQDELRTQYDREQELYNNKALLSKETKEKLELNFMYELPPGRLFFSLGTNSSA